MSIRITTLGRVAIHRDGHELTELPGQALRCALLVYLAVEEEAGRDALMAMFWPRRKAARARHSLNQTVYQLRNVLGRDAIESRGDLLRVGPSVAVDTFAFEEAAESGNLSAALDHYHGPFLEGDPLAAGKAFGTWVARQRGRHERLHRAVRREHICRLLADGDDAAAVASARAWVRLEPLSEEAQQQLTALLRRTDVSGASAPERAPRSRAVPVAAPGGTPWRARLAVLLALAVLLVTLVARPGGTPDSGTPARAVTIGVVPFAGLGMPPDSSASIQAAFVSALEWPAGWQAVDAASLLGVRGEPGSSGGDQAMAAAREQGLHYLLTGQLGAGPGAPGLSVSAWDVEAGTRAFHATAEASETPEDASARMAYQLVRDLSAREGARLPLPLGVLHGTESATARGHFLRGRQLMGRGEGEAARAAFLRAAAADPSFGHAWFRAGFAHPEGSHRTMLAIAEQALRHRTRMAPRSTRLLEGLDHYARRDASEAIDAFERLVQEGPDDADAWYGLAVSVHHLGAPTGHDPGRARAAFHHLLSLDSGYAAVQPAAFDLALAHGDFDAAAALLRHAHRSTVVHQEGRYTARSLLLAMITGAEEERRAALDSMRWQDRSTVAEAVRVLVRSGAGLPLVDSLGAILQESIRTPTDRRFGGQVRLVARAGLGDWEGAMDAWTSTSETEAPDAFVTLAEIAGLPLTDAGTTAASDRRAPRAESVSDFAVPDFAVPDFALPVDDSRRVAFRAVAAWTAARGDSTAAAGLIRAIRDARPTASPTDPMPQAMEAALRARLALLAADTAAALHALQQALARPAWPYLQDLPLTCMAPQRLMVARLLAARGDSASARRWARTFRASGCMADPLFQPALASAGLDGSS